MILTLNIVADLSERDDKCETKIVTLEKNGSRRKTDKFITRQPVVSEKDNLSSLLLILGVLQIVGSRKVSNL